MGIGRIVYGFDFLLKIIQEEEQQIPLKVIKAGEIGFNHFVFENILT